jgi:hypothetical protein
MRKLFSILAIAALTACAGDATGPGDSRLDMATLAYGGIQVGEAGSGDDLMARLSNLPAAVALSAAQISQISSLIANFTSATNADRNALAAIQKEAADARAAGKTADEVRAILARGADIRARLQQSERTLRDAVFAVLTTEQRAALSNRPAPTPRPCAMTDAQRTEISGLLAAFEQANAADIAAIRSAHERAAAARQSGASRDAVAAILAEARAAMARLETARASLQTAIKGVFTAEQIAAGCGARGGSGPRGR